MEKEVKKAVTGARKIAKKVKKLAKKVAKVKRKPNNQAKKVVKRIVKKAAKNPNPARTVKERREKSKYIFKKHLQLENKNLSIFVFYIFYY